uniref:DUF5131 family protein n=1 Tax=Steinernema glaseri TaxID=37863 RepID=A0A1I7YYU8_9BILA
MYKCYLRLSWGQEYYEPEEWLRNNTAYGRIRDVCLKRSRFTEEGRDRTLEEALQCALRVVPYLSDLSIMTACRFNTFRGGERFDFLWKRPCPILRCSGVDNIILGWHLENNDKLKTMLTPLVSYDYARDLIPHLAKKRVPWRMIFGLSTYSLERLRTWQGDAQWDELYPSLASWEPQPRRGNILYEDEYMVKQFLWTSRSFALLRVTWT